MKLLILVLFLMWLIGRLKVGSVKPNMRYIVEYYSGTNFETFVSKDTVRI